MNRFLALAVAVYLVATVLALAAAVMAASLVGQLLEQLRAVIP